MELKLDGWRPWNEFSTTQFEVEGQELAVGPMMSPLGFAIAIADHTGTHLLVAGSQTLIHDLDYSIRGALDEPAVAGEHDLVCLALQRAATPGPRPPSWGQRFGRSLVALRAMSEEQIARLTERARANLELDTLTTLGVTD